MVEYERDMKAAASDTPDRELKLGACKANTADLSVTLTVMCSCMQLQHFNLCRHYKMQMSSVSHGERCAAVCM